jgi:hypothetical protein
MIHAAEDWNYRTVSGWIGTHMESVKLEQGYKALKLHMTPPTFLSLKLSTVL